jgi:uncharacterized protein
MATPNPFILAADNDPKLLPLLHSTPTLASSQDAHGYSILHAAASYNHLDLLRQVVSEFHIDPNIKDEDGETPLFVVETVQAAQMLVEELGIDTTIKNSEDLTAEQKIRGEGDYVAVADFLQEKRLQRGLQSRSAEEGSESSSTGPFNVTNPPPLPRSLNVDVTTIDEDLLLEGAGVDSEFKRRIEELATREDFQEEEVQRQLRELITDVVRDHRAENTERDVRQRFD